MLVVDKHLAGGWIIAKWDFFRQLQVKTITETPGLFTCVLAADDDRFTCFRINKGELLVNIGLAAVLNRIVGENGNTAAGLNRIGRFYNH